MYGDTFTRAIDFGVTPLDPCLPGFPHSMVDCFDRIAVQMTEIALEPVRMLRDRPMLAAVTLRTPSSGRRFNVTIEKRFPKGTEQPPVYVWSLVEVSIEGPPVVESATASTPEHVYAQPEDAYWGAVDALCAIQREKR